MKKKNSSFVMRVKSAWKLFKSTQFVLVVELGGKTLVTGESHHEFMKFAEECLNDTRWKMLDNNESNE